MKKSFFFFRGKQTRKNRQGRFLLNLEQKFYSGVLCLAAKYWSPSSHKFLTRHCCSLIKIKDPKLKKNIKIKDPKMKNLAFSSQRMNNCNLSVFCTSSYRKISRSNIFLLLLCHPVCGTGLL